MHDENEVIHLTQNEYERFLHEYVYQNELDTPKTYFLRPRNNFGNQPQAHVPKKVSKESKEMKGYDNPISI